MNKIVNRASGILKSTKWVFPECSKV